MMNKATMNGAMAVAALLLASLTPAAAQSYHGVTCDDVRALTPAERDYWSERLSLSAEQRYHIEVTCSVPHRHPRGHWGHSSASATNQ